MIVFLVLLAAYLLGSVVFGVIYSHLRGDEVRGRDMPGGSGMFRQYGLGPALTISALDILKGVLAAYLAVRFAPGWAWAAMFLVIIGHCYPVFFRFNGGGGIAPMLGAMLVIAPKTLLLMILLSLIVMPLYKSTIQKKVGLNVIPFMSAVVLPISVVASLWLGGTLALIAATLGMAARSVQLLIEDGKLGRKAA
ncbi:glycerol-3-phosphate acyltransferase [Deinococcus rubellus]|uniref:Glycerol-3-phosphate acyltransferase n=1 Tax=Deinococcus rubellus TaxID=1889240 RepID=A0ABY5YGW0_9DEIO|nr:glycerol-3-phosphate acyltransferase [Deinococcus rubellus]UWX64308.1 glycerol-3-phosphate acyltransferase [Deinococcus rubellus]